MMDEDSPKYSGLQTFFCALLIIVIGTGFVYMMNNRGDAFNTLDELTEAKNEIHEKTNSH